METFSSFSLIIACLQGFFTAALFFIKNDELRLGWYHFFTTGVILAHVGGNLKPGSTLSYLPHRSESSKVLPFETSLETASFRSVRGVKEGDDKNSLSGKEQITTLASIKSDNKYVDENENENENEVGKMELVDFEKDFENK